MKHLYTIFFAICLSFCIASPKSKIDSINIQKIQKLDEDIQHAKQDLLEKTIVSYQQTNDRLNNYLSFTGTIATIFGVIIALGGIWVAFESWKSQQKRNEAIKILEDAKNYVENKKTEFNNLLENKIDELENDYRKLIELAKDRLLQDINTESLQVKELAEKKTQEIEEFSIKERRDDVLESLQKRLDFFENIGIPDDPAILISKAKLLREKEMFKEAIVLLQKVITITPDSWDTYFELGYNYSKLDEMNESINSYKKSISIKDNSSSHNNLAVWYEKQNKFYDSLHEFEQAIALDPKTKLYHQNKARILRKLNSTEPAIDELKLIIDLDKTDIKSYRELIDTLVSLARLDDALEYFDLAILNNADKTSELNYLKAQLLYQSDKKTDALTLLQSLLPFNYKPEECLQIIAQIKLDIGETSEAFKILDSLQELNVKNPFAYIKKAEVILPDNKNEALAIVLKGGENINTAEFYLSSARIFARHELYEQAKQLQLKAIEMLQEKILDPKEADLLNLYETLIIVEKYDDAEKLINEHLNCIKSGKYKIIRELLTLCLRMLKNVEINFELEIEKFKYLKGNNTEKINWNCDDIEYYLKSKNDHSKFKPIFSLIQYLQDKITVESLLSGIINS